MKKIVLTLIVSSLISFNLYASNNTIKKNSCIKLNKIDLEDNEILDESSQKDLFEKYIGKCIDSNNLKNIIKDISNFYMDEGYITTKPYIKEQNIKDGQIDITVLKGTVEDIIHAETNATSGKIATAFIFQKGQALNLRALETSLEMINRVESSDADFEIIPGNKNGQSIISIKTKKTLPIHLSLGASGSKTIKDSDPNLTGILKVDNLVGINDILKYTYNGSRIQREYQSTKGKELNYSFPIGSYLIEFVVSDFSYRQGISGAQSTILYNGKTKGKKLQVSKVLARDQRNKFEIQSSIYHKDTKSYNDGALLPSSSYKTTLLQLDLLHTNYQSWGQIYTVYSIYQGKDWFGAMTDDGLNSLERNDNKEKLEFIKYSLDNTLYYYFNDSSYSFNSNFHLQYTKDKLYNNDKLTVGSDYTVRGYKDSNLYGNNAWYLKNDLKKTFDLSIEKHMLKEITMFVGLDLGKVRCEENTIEHCGEIYGKAIGFTTSGDNFSTDFTWSKPIKPIGSGSKKESLFSFNIQLDF